MERRRRAYATPTGGPCPHALREDGDVEGDGDCVACGCCLLLLQAAWPEVATVPTVPAPAAVLLDSGGIFLLPDHQRIVGAFARAEVPVAPEALDAAHYRAAARFTTDLDVEGDWVGCWQGYLETYIAACGIEPGERREEVHAHVDSEFADAALWVKEAEGCREGLAALAAAGVRLGVISNADGQMAARLRERELLQVGPGLGVEVECVIDSGDVGVLKPDVRIFEIALQAMGLEAADCWYLGDMPAIDAVGATRAGMRPFILDPLGIHPDTEYTPVPSLQVLAELAAEGAPAAAGG
jgi:FMN phosphatase YigB (HAD superfamily)